MNYSSALISSVITFAIATAGCAADGTDPTEATTQGSQEELAAGGSTSAGTSGVPRSVLVNYAFWNLTGPNIPADPPARSSCSSPLDAVTYLIVGCKDAQDADVTLPSSETSGVYCSANDGSGVTKVQAECLGGWLMSIAAINGKKIPANVILTGANKVAASVTAVVLLECPTPPPGLGQHNVIYKAVYNEGVFASKVPAGCTSYELTPS